MKEISNLLLLKAKLMIDGVPESHVNHILKEDSKKIIIDSKNVTFTSTVLGKGDDATKVGIKALEKEIEKRRLRPILPVIPQTGKILIEQIEVVKNTKSGSIHIPDHISAKDMQLLQEHPHQGTVVGIGRDVDYPGLSIGSRVYLNTLPPEIFVYKSQVYYAIPQHLIVCLAFR